MDKLKAQLAVLKKYGFWIASAIVLLGSVAIWYMTTSTLVAETESKASKIRSAVQQVSSTRGELPTLPNDLSHARMEELIAERQEEVLESWTSLYERQQKILKWPREVLTQELVREFEGKLPIETHIEFPTEEINELETSLRDQYARYIKNVLPDIAEIAGAQWEAEFEGASMSMDMMDSMGDYGSMMGRREVSVTGAEQGPLVKWDTASQQAVLKDLFPWRGDLPTTLEIYYSQENLWILRQLMQIISDVNGEATQPFQAKIREIRKIGIGSSVKFGEGNISQPGSTASGGMMGMDMEMEMMDEMGDMGMGEMGDMGEMMGGMEAVQVDPADDRYVNALREPIDGATLRGALSSNSPSDAALAVAKRVPVMMSLVMDQRAVPDLIAACGSAPLMVEISQVRILPKGATASSAGMMMGGDEEEMDMGGMEMDGMGGGMGMMGGGMTMGPRGNEPADEFPLDMSVQIYGIIYIYNPPDEEKLGVEQVTEETVVEGVDETMGGQPVAQPPATSQPATSEPATSAPATSEPATSEPATPTPGGNGELPTPQPDAATPTPPSGPGNGATPAPPGNTPAAAPGGANGNGNNANGTNTNGSAAANGAAPAAAASPPAAGG